MKAQIVVMAKAPVPGRVKTRLCPPCTPEQAAAVAAAALADTFDAVGLTPAVRRVLALSGSYAPPPGWCTASQRGADLGDRLAYAFADTALPWTASVLVGMDTPQVRPDLLTGAIASLARADAVLGPAEDGGWWILALREPRHGAVLRGVPMSRSDTGELTAAALRRAGLVVAIGPRLRDVDTAADAWAIARDCVDGRFAAAVAAHIPASSGAYR
jgi:hypothetical protein